MIVIGHHNKSYTIDLQNNTVYISKTISHINGKPIDKIVKHYTHKFNSGYWTTIRRKKCGSAVDVVNVLINLLGSKRKQQIEEQLMEYYLLC